VAAALPCKPLRRYEAQRAEAARHDPAPLLQGRQRVSSEFKLYGVSGANQTLTHDALRSWLHRKLSSSSVKCEGSGLEIAHANYIRKVPDGSEIGITCSPEGGSAAGGSRVTILPTWRACENCRSAVVTSAKG